MNISIEYGDGKRIVGENLSSDEAGKLIKLALTMVQKQEGRCKAEVELVNESTGETCDFETNIDKLVKLEEE